MRRRKPQSIDSSPVPLGVSHTFSSLVDRELIARIRDVEAAMVERDRASEANGAAETRYATACRRFADCYRAVSSALDEGFTLVFEGKNWTVDRDVDDTLIVFANNVVVLTE